MIWANIVSLNSVQLFVGAIKSYLFIYVSFYLLWFSLIILFLGVHRCFFILNNFSPYSKLCGKFEQVLKELFGHKSVFNFLYKVKDILLRLDKRQ